MSVPPHQPDPFGSPRGNPYGPPPPVHQHAYSAHQPGHPVQGQAQPVPAQYWHAPQPFQTPPRQGNGLAVTAIVLSGLALLGVLGLAAFFAVGASMGPSWVLTGEVAVSGSAVAGPELEAALVGLVEDDGGSVDEITCPESSTVGQGLVTVCHGGVDGWDWTGVVVFEDAEGGFIVNQL
jgi:hypothetical protein